MIRRARTALAVPALALAAGALSACSTFTDSDVAARVADAELSRDELDELIVAATPGASADEPVEVAGDTARTLISNWLLTRVLEQAIDDEGGTITDDDRAAAAASLQERFPGWETTPEVVRELQVQQQAAIDVWSALEVPALGDDELRALYERGIVASDIACTAHVLVDTEAEAREVIAELDAGAAFADVAAERSTDTGSAANGGVLPCSTAASFTQQYVTEYVEGAIATSVGEYSEPVRSSFGYHVILVRPFDEVVDEGIAELYTDTGARFRRTAADADVYVDPRYGTFDANAGVVALG